MKICSGCKNGYPETAEFFVKDKRKRQGLDCRCKICRGEYHHNRYAGRKKEHAIAMKEYRGTITGRLRNIYGSMKQRCRVQKSYTAKGIKNLFATSDIFVDYVINELKVDPRGLVVHRINNNGNYEPGNIEFLTASNHFNLHWATTRREAV